VVGRGGWRRSSGGGGAVARFPVREWFVAVGEWAGEVEGDVGELTTTSIRAEEDWRVRIDGDPELRVGLPWRPVKVGAIRPR